MNGFESVVPAEKIDPSWMTQVLIEAGRLRGARVRALRREPCGAGHVGDSFRFTLEYDVPGAGPATLVGKFPSGDAVSRDFGGRAGWYRCEIGFYRELAAQLGISVPTALHVAMSPNETDFVLLMDDLAPARQVEQMASCSVDESALVLEQAALLHARSWRSAELAGREWLRGSIDIYSKATDDFADVLRRFTDLYREVVPVSDLEVPAKLVRHRDAWKQWLRTPRCLWHLDLRSDNVMFDACGGRRPVVVLDWQCLGFGQGTIDVAYWIGTSLSVEDRRRHERTLVAMYHDALHRNGVRDYSSEQCWNDYRVNAIHGMQVGIFAPGVVKRTPRGDRMWKEWFERTVTQVRDLDSFSVLARM